VREDFEHLQALANQFQRRSGHAPSNWRELIMFAGLPSIPVDPQGRAYRLLPGGRFAVDPATKIRSMTEKLPG
jgi:hypothetical protein